MKKFGRFLVLCIVASSLTLVGCGAKKANKEHEEAKKACSHAVKVLKKDPATKKLISNLPKDQRASLTRKIQQKFESSCRAACRKNPKTTKCVMKAKRVKSLERCIK
ncbi:MAG: hypothetical protein CMH54_00280 [Myxococcales bacterium]|nr:hypothetical protein [Myxococcales bacterium]|tara:strand:- start:1684 stop:2004 length:321 start_codon:yes stop_codon:yes gene_type:complete